LIYFSEYILSDLHTEDVAYRRTESRWVWGLGFVMEQAGTHFENKKRKCNGKTTNPVVAKKKG
jgi:hypothetical protein